MIEPQMVTRKEKDIGDIAKITNDVRRYHEITRQICLDDGELIRKSRCRGIHSFFPLERVFMYSASQKSFADKFVSSIPLSHITDGHMKLLILQKNFEVISKHVAFFRGKKDQ